MWSAESQMTKLPKNHNQPGTISAATAEDAARFMDDLYATRKLKRIKEICEKYLTANASPDAYALASAILQAAK